MYDINLDIYRNILCKTISDIDSNKILSLTKSIIQTINNKNNIILMGNGGSAANASHIACDINRVIEKLNARSMALCLSDNISNITRISNDISFESIYVNQLKYYSKKGDLVIALSTSGRSMNIINAINYLNDRHIRTVLITGTKCQLKSTSDNKIIVLNSSHTQILEDIQTIIFHAITNKLYDVISEDMSIPIIQTSNA